MMNTEYDTVSALSYFLSPCLLAAKYGNYYVTLPFLCSSPSSSVFPIIPSIFSS